MAPHSNITNPDIEKNRTPSDPQPYACPGCCCCHGCGCGCATCMCRMKRVHVDANRNIYSGEGGLAPVNETSVIAMQTASSRDTTLCSSEESSGSLSSSYDSRAEAVPTTTLLTTANLHRLGAIKPQSRRFWERYYDQVDAHPFPHFLSPLEHPVRTMDINVHRLNDSSIMMPSTNLNGHGSGAGHRSKLSSEASFPAPPRSLTSSDQIVGVGAGFTNTTTANTNANMTYLWLSPECRHL